MKKPSGGTALCPRQACPVCIVQVTSQGTRMSVLYILCDVIRGELPLQLHNYLSCTGHPFSLSIWAGPCIDRATLARSECLGFFRFAPRSISRIVLIFRGCIFGNCSPTSCSMSNARHGSLVENDWGEMDRATKDMAPMRYARSSHSLRVKKK